MRPAARQRPVLLGDIGGTNARFALLDDDQLGPIGTLAVAEHPDLADALAAFLDRAVTGAPPRAAVLAVAGPVTEGRAGFTNSPWVVDGAGLERRFGFAPARILNDFEAVAWALPHLAPAELFPIGAGSALPRAPLVALGPGTGLGVACYLPGPPAPRVLATEGGHITLAVGTDREAAVLERMRHRYGHVSAERALSGPGLAALYEAIAALDGARVPERDAAAVTAAALAGTCPVSAAALDMFCALLGSFAGDAALMFGARGGVYIAGGIAPRIADRLAASAFRPRFEAKGRFAAYLAAVPVGIVLRPDPAFLGLQAVARGLGGPWAD